MKIVVINGTPVKGCTYQLKEMFVNIVKADNDVVEFELPRDLPNFCCGCKNCFFKGEDKCPHAAHTLPLWSAMMEADLILLAYPVYALRAPASIKTMLDHFCVHWIVHRPKQEMFQKRVAILTNSIGAPNGAAQKDAKTSFAWMGVSDIGALGFGLMEGVYWNDLSEKRKRDMRAKTERFAKKCLRPIKRSMSLKTKLFFGLSKTMHQSGYRKELAKGGEPMLDDRYWAEMGWITKT